jgi:acetyl esterase/lipase
MSQTSKIQFLSFLPLLLNSVALLSVIWIIVPAPAYNVWLFSVVASEWSLWLGALALIGIICCLFNRDGNLWLVSLAVGIIALIISLYPFFSVVEVARKQNVSLSLSRYFNGLFRTGDFSKADTKNFTTYTFAQIDEKDLQLDVYLPTQDTANNGAGLIVIHGGSWNAGERNDFPQWNAMFAAEGFTVFDVDYRLVQPNYLTATGDVKCAVKWVKENAVKFRISPDRIALLGRSAGGHLALLAAYSAGDARLPASCSETPTIENVRAVVSVYAPTDLLWAYDNPANGRVINGPQTLANFLGGSPHESVEIRERYILASPVSRIASNTPPTLLIHGGQDQLVRPENMNLLAGKLKEANAPHKTLFISYAQHGFDYNFNGWGAQISKAAILNFLRDNTQQR